MKNTGTKRKLDPLGRIVLPIELRKTLNINTGDSIRIYIDGEDIVLRKDVPNNPLCLFCGRKTDLLQYKDKFICGRCIAKL